MKKLTVKQDGEEAQAIHLTGSRRSPEPTYVRIYFPGGDVTVARTAIADPDRPDYWVHVSVNTPDDGGDPDRQMAVFSDARADRTDRHASETASAFSQALAKYRAAASACGSDPKSCATTTKELWGAYLESAAVLADLVDTTFSDPNSHHLAVRVAPVWPR